MNYKTPIGKIAADIDRGDIIILGQVHLTVASTETVQSHTVIRFTNGAKSLFVNGMKVMVSGHADLIPETPLEDMRRITGFQYAGLEIDETIKSLKNLRQALIDAGLI